VLVEVVAAIRRRTGAADLAARIERDFLALAVLRFIELELNRARAREASAIARAAALRGMDALLLQVAREFGATLVTLDREMLDRAAPYVDPVPPAANARGTRSSGVSCILPAEALHGRGGELLGKRLPAPGTEVAGAAKEDCGDRLVQRACGGDGRAVRPERVQDRPLLRGEQWVDALDAARPHRVLQEHQIDEHPLQEKRALERHVTLVPGGDHRVQAKDAEELLHEECEAIA